MTELSRTAQALGGAARKATLGDWERSFVAMLGGSKRPITKDRRPSPDQVASELRQEGVKEPIPWNAYVAVGMNGTVVPSTLSKDDQVKAIKRMGEIAGFAGLIRFNREWRTYTRRLLLDPVAQKRLDAASNFFIQHVREFERKELEHRGHDANNALLSAQVYLDPGGETFSMFYSFHPDQFPKQGSTRVGIVYVVNAKQAAGHYDVPANGSPWLVRFHLEDPKNDRFAAIMKEATKHFSEIVAMMHKIQVSEVPKE
jgi:hypothetical protein